MKTKAFEDRKREIDCCCLPRLRQSSGLGELRIGRDEPVTRSGSDIVLQVADLSCDSKPSKRMNPQGRIYRGILQAKIAPPGLFRVRSGSVVLKLRVIVMD